MKDWNEAGQSGFSAKEAGDNARRWTPGNGGEQRADTGWRAHAVTAGQLSSMRFPPINYIVPDVLPEGLTILAGRPKIGKSWLALDTCLAVADEAETTVLGRDPAHGDALYCALEDTNRRLQHRASKLLWPHR